MATRHTTASKTGSTPARKPTASASAATTAFGGEDHLQELVRVFQKIFELVALRAKNFGRELCGNFYAGHRGVFRDVTNLVDLYACFSGKCGLELFSERSWFCVAGRKRAHKTRELWLRKARREMDTGDARS